MNPYCPIREHRFLLGLSAILAWAAPGAFASAAERPNIVLIYADDLGYGDVGCYGATKVATPNIDRVASEGLRFTDAHSSAATCTPSRYSLLSGEYAWRRRGTGILRGDAPLIIEPGRPTLASILKRAGYATGVVGKWHLGLGSGNLDWNHQIKPGPLEIGFDSCFLIPATGDRTPCVYVEDHRVVGLDANDPVRVSYGEPIGDDPTGRSHPELLKMKLTHGHDNTIVNGISRIGYMSGGASARWVDEDMADAITGKAVEFIERHRAAPFFLYFSTHDIHVPRVPHPRFQGKSECGIRGDVIVQFDSCVGEIMATLDRLQLAENTLLIITSDNGPVLDDGYADGAVEDLNGHRPAGPWRGGKYSNFEGGTRVPFVVRWPARVKPGESDALVGQIDLLASLAALAEQELPKDAGPDSENVLSAMLGESPQGRKHLVAQASVTSLRSGPWKLIPAAPGPKVQSNTNTETGNAPDGQLYNLAEDQGETKNLAAENPERVRELAALLAEIRNTTAPHPPTTPKTTN
jgi:arylsulfatase A-like enzyme